MEKFRPSREGHEGDILVVEDEKLSRLALGMLLAAEGYNTIATESAEEAVEVLLSDGSAPTIVLIDLDLPGMSGAELLAYLKKLAPLIRPVLVTAACEERITCAIGKNNVRYLRKPIDFMDLLGILKEPQSAN
jgi:two-component system, OmpR family, response regulator